MTSSLVIQCFEKTFAEFALREY